MIFYQANRCAHINQGEPGEPAPGRTRANQGAKYIRANMTKPGRTHKRANQANQGEPGTRVKEPGADLSQHLRQLNQGEPGRGSILYQDQHQDQANQGEPAPGSAPAPGSGQDQHQDQHQVKKPPEIVQKTINLAWNCTKNDQSAQKTIKVLKKRTKTRKSFRCTGCQSALSPILAPFSPIFADFTQNAQKPFRCTGCQNRCTGCQRFGVWVSY